MCAKKKETSVAIRPGPSGRRWAGSIERISGGSGTGRSSSDVARLRTLASNRLARAEASRTPNSDLNALNAAFGTDPVFRVAMRRVLAGASRDELDPEQRISLTNIQEQLAREVREGVLVPGALDFGGTGSFRLPYYRSSWPLYRTYLTSTFVRDFERP